MNLCFTAGFPSVLHCVVFCGFTVCLVPYVAAGTGDRNLLLSLRSRKVGVMLETMVKQERETHDFP